MKKANLLSVLAIFGILFFLSPFIEIGFQDLPDTSRNKKSNDSMIKSSYSDQYEIIQLSDSEFYDSMGQFNDGLVVWSGGPDTFSLEIFLYNVSDGITTQITDNDYEDRLPQVSDGIITWLGKVDGDYEVFLYKSGVITQITNTEYSEYYPRIDDGLITWRGGWPISDPEIFFYNTSSDQITQITDNPYSDYSPQIHAGLITWWGWGGSSMDIFVYNTSSQTKFQVTQNNYPEDFPQIHDGLISWRCNIDGKIKLMVYDYNKKEIVHEADMIHSLGHNSHGGLIAYTGREVAPDGSYLDVEIFVYDYGSDTTTQLTFDDYFDYYPKVHDGEIVWQGINGISVYDYATGRSTAVTPIRGVPYIHDGLIAFMASSDIFLAKPLIIREIEKILSASEGELGDTVKTSITVEVPEGEIVTVIDSLPECFEFIKGSFLVDGLETIPSVVKGEISYIIVDPGTHIIEFDLKIDEAKNWEETDVCNIATATWYFDGEQVDHMEDTECFTIHAFQELQKEVKLPFDSEIDDPLTIMEKTETQWILVMELTNTFDYIMTDVKITDNFGAEIEIDETFPLTISHGTVSYTIKGKSDKVFLTWDIGDLDSGETAKMYFLISTDLNPAGQQEYSSPGVFELNSGATLKFSDLEDVQLSAFTDKIFVIVLPLDV